MNTAEHRKERPPLRIYAFPPCSPVVSLILFVFACLIVGEVAYSVASSSETGLFRGIRTLLALCVVLATSMTLMCIAEVHIRRLRDGLSLQDLREGGTVGAWVPHRMGHLYLIFWLMLVGFLAAAFVGITWVDSPFGLLG